MKRAELKQIIKETLIELKNEILKENQSFTLSGVSPDALRELGITPADAAHIVEIALEVRKRVGDSGTCVIGGGLMANGKKIITAYSQGSLGPEEIYKKVRNYLIPRYPKIEFRIEWGNMD